MTAKDPRLPDEKEEEHVTQPAEQPPAKTCCKHAPNAGREKWQDNHKEMKSVPSFITTHQPRAQATTRAIVIW
jgi:hypothetical protein